MRVFALALIFSFVSNVSLGCDCTEASRKQELAYIRGAVKTAWNRYQATHPYAGNGWRGNAGQTAVDAINWIATLPGKLDVFVLNTIAGEERYYVKPGPDYGVRCQQVFDGMLPIILAELRKASDNYSCLRIAQVIQSGVNGSNVFNHVYFGITDFSKPANQARSSMTDIVGFSDPWADGTGNVVMGAIGYVPSGQWLGKSVHRANYMGLTMPGEGEGRSCTPDNSCTVPLGGKYVFALDSTTWGPSPGYVYSAPAYTFNLEQYLGQIAGWDYLSPFQGNIYGLLPAIPIQYVNGIGSNLSQYAGGQWRVVNHTGTGWDETAQQFTEDATSVVASGSLAPNAVLLNAPATVDRLGTYSDMNNPTGVISMSVRTALEVSCNGSWPAH